MRKVLLPFYLKIEAFVRVPGSRLQAFGAKKIESYIAIPKVNIIDFEFEESDAEYELFEYDGKMNNKSVNDKAHPVSRVFGKIVATSDICPLRR
jgi:hypothetical protein